MKGMFPKSERVYFVGIKGVAMAALAVWSKEAGNTIAGSDTSEEFPTDELLHRAGIAVHQGFDADHIVAFKPDFVIYTGAHGGLDNPQVQRAIKMGIPCVPHGKALGEFMDGKRQISVAGSHGKTTTSAMIASILTNAGLDPSYAIGCGMIRGIGFSGHFGTGEFFVAEADEYVTDPGHDATPRFCWQHPEVFVVTNIDFDHPDVYGNLQSVQEAFARVLDLNKGCTAIVNMDDGPSAILTRKKNRILSYGFSQESDLCITHVTLGEGKTIFTLSYNGLDRGEFELIVPGRHNVFNAAACVLTCYELGISWEVIRKGLRTFSGTKRRCEIIREARGILLIDDYAHHPGEIRATLEGIRNFYPKHRIITVFQPHTYTRTRALFDDFSFAFKKSDIVAITDIYASAREEVRSGELGKKLADAIRTKQKNTYYTRGMGAVRSLLRRIIETGDVIVLMGAGDIYTWGSTIKDML